METEETHGQSAARRPETAAQHPASHLGGFEKATAAEASKLEPDTARQAQASEVDAEVAVIVKVTEDGYVPPGVQVRARLSPRLFTARLVPADLERLQQDTRVDSVATAKPLRPL